MSDLFYNLVWHLGYPAFWVSSRPTIINADITQRRGPYILAANHHSPYDIPLLMRHTRRNLDFVSIVEVFSNPLLGWFYGSMNAFPLDRSRPDALTVRRILDRLARGRVVAMFPEGQFRGIDESVVSGGSIKPGIGRIAILAGVPIIPCVIVNSMAYSRFAGWLPLRRTRYGIIYGQPLQPDPRADTRHAAAELEQRVCLAFRQLYRQLLEAMGRREHGESGAGALTTPMARQRSGPRSG
ncbi:lysophospholipid acyltransferase family protein [Fontivita pretiosa]|uniref:lysophospholipid acyltransferase family protein n=1 Tax=Fontivita pretiosa TaxID=2989684 RepID=UPI003D16E1B8